MDKDAVNIVGSAFSTKKICSALSYLSQTNNLGHAKKKKSGRHVWCLDDVVLMPATRLHYKYSYSSLPSKS